MTTKTLWLGVGAVALVLLAGVGALWLSGAPIPFTKYQKGSDIEEGAFCTLDAKLCPDGSYVGRIAPNCEFAACPAATSSPTGGGTTSVRLETKIDQGASALGVRIVPLTVLEDSRCAIDVTCIQAGTVRVRAGVQAGSDQSTREFTLNTPVTTPEGVVTLVEVTPAPRSGVTIAAGEYKFVFTVTKPTPVGGDKG